MFVFYFILIYCIFGNAQSLKNYPVFAFACFCEELGAVLLSGREFHHSSKFLRVSHISHVNITRQKPNKPNPY